MENEMSAGLGVLKKSTLKMKSAVLLTISRAHANYQNSG
jgi:hypothetical protein